MCNVDVCWILVNINSTSEIELVYESTSLISKLGVNQFVNMILELWKLNIDGKMFWF